MVLISSRLALVAMPLAEFSSGGAEFQSCGSEREYSLIIRRNCAHRELTIQTQIEVEHRRGLHGAWGLGPYGRLIVATGPEGGVTRNVERVHDMRWLLECVPDGCENAGMRKVGVVESNAEGADVAF